MRVYVNDQPIDLLPGMKVHHALIGAGYAADVHAEKQVCDQWGNLIGLDGALSEGMKIFVR